MKWIFILVSFISKHIYFEFHRAPSWLNRPAWLRDETGERIAKVQVTRSCSLHWRDFAGRAIGSGSETRNWWIVLYMVSFSLFRGSFKTWSKGHVLPFFCIIRLFCLFSYHVVMQCLPCSSCWTTTLIPIWYWYAWFLGKVHLKIQPRNTVLPVINTIVGGRSRYTFSPAYIHYKIVTAAREWTSW